MKNNNIFYTSPQTLASLPQSTPVLLALSGGEDSCVLFDLILKDSKKNGFVLHAAHFNHHIRGKDAERDADFCLALAKANSIPFHLGEADVPALAQINGNSIESEAREQRYAFFEKIMRENNIPILVTAHHADDNVESVLLHILRGSGIQGLCGISECRTFANDFFIVRPILKTEKEAITTYCKENCLGFVTDNTNYDLDYSRNRIRALLTPEMKNLQPNLCSVISRLAESASEANDFILNSAINFIEAECQENGIPLDKFNQLAKIVKANVISIAFKNVSGKTLERVHIDDVIMLCEKAEPHSSISLPAKFCAKIENERLLFTNKTQKTQKTDFCIPLAEGEFILPLTHACACARTHVLINIEKNPVNFPSNDDISLDLNANLIDCDAHFRPRCEGDVIFADKMNKKAKKLICEKKIPLEIRNVLPILVSKNEILWIPCVAVCDKVKRDKIKEDDDFFRITVKFVN